MPRHLLRLAALAALPALAACGGGDDPASPHATPSNPALIAVAGRWITQSAAGAPLPAPLDEDVDGGDTIHVHLLADTLELRLDGTWEERGRYEVRLNGVPHVRPYFYNRGRWTRVGDAVVFESTYIQRSDFGAELQADGSLVSEQNPTMDSGVGTATLVRRK